jgi:CubicO group peptidase (beta-lactamase class C family)
MITKAMALFLLVLLIFPFGQAQQPGEKSYQDSSILPKGKIGKQIVSIINTINSNNPDKVRQFIKSNCTTKFQDMAPMDRHIRVFSSIGRRTGGLKFHSIRTYVPERKDETVVILKDNNYETWQAFVVKFSSKPAYLIDSLYFSDARTPTNVKESSLSQDQFLPEVNKIMQRLKTKDVFSGTVLIAKGDEILYKRANGEASKRFHVANNINTKFNLGSMNKMFTSVSIVQLAEQGKLAYKDSISKFVDETWLPKEIADKITIHHLLTHTSGLGSYFNDTYVKSSKQLFRKLSDYKILVKEEKLAFTPGERFRYSNTGMFLLGVIIEKVSGQDYFDYIRENIYKPAGMENSDCYEMDYPVENLAIGYSPDSSKYGWQNNLYKHVIKGGPAGGGFSTVVDLHRFAQALLSGKLVSKKSLKTLWTDYADANYGYGFSLDKGPSGLVVGHGGGFAGINSNLDIFVDKGYIVAVMSNIDMGASPLARKIAQLVHRVK